MLVSAGVGVTPMLAMLHALHDRRSTRDIWWLHGARNRSEHAFADEAPSLLDDLAHVHRRIWYSRPGPTDRAGTDYDAVGHITPEALEAARVPLDGEYYLCGPTAFMDALRDGLAGLGVPAERVHTEIFGAHEPITPGVVAGPTRPPHQPDGAPGSGPLVSFVRSGLNVRWGDGQREHPRAGRGLRRAGAMVVSHRRLPHLRDRSPRRNRRVLPRATRCARRRQPARVLLHSPTPISRSTCDLVLDSRTVIDDSITVMPTDSVLDAQAELVRSRVLEGVAQLLSEGEELTFARVATAAGVSERTVYRHFANRDTLMAAVYSWANDRIGFAGTPPTTAADMTAMVRQVFPGFDAVAPVVDELLTSAEGRRARLADLDARQHAATAVVADAAPTLDATTQRQVAAVVQVLGTARRCGVEHRRRVGDDRRRRG